MSDSAPSPHSEHDAKTLLAYWLSNAYPTHHHNVALYVRSLEEQYEVRTQNLRDCNERSRALAEKCVALEEQLEATRSELAEATQDEITYFKRMEELETRLRQGADYGETPEIRAWCLLALTGAVNEHLAGSNPASSRLTIADDYAEFERGRAAGEFVKFARCPECQSATVGIAPPYGINHAKGCSLSSPATTPPA